MYFEGTFIVNTPRERVWTYISDPRSVAKCVPGLKKLEVQAKDKFTAKIELGIGWVKGNFDFKFTVTEEAPPSHAKLSAQGSGVRSEINFDVAIDLTDTSKGGTVLSWKADAMVGGLLAGVGQRLLGSMAKKIVDQLFENMRSELENGNPT